MNSNRDYATENINLKKRLETLESNSDKVIKDSVKLINKNLELQQENEKHKKAFKLVTDIYLMNYWDIAKKLNNNIINKQEYELLKEVLGNGD